MEILEQILNIFVLGMIGGAIPGAMLTSILTESLRKGFFNSLRVILKAMAAESIIAFFILVVIFSLSIPQDIFYGISFFGAVVLVWVAWQIWQIKELGGEGEIFSFKKIFLLAALGGPFWIFWITIGVPMAFFLKQQIPAGHLLFLLIFELGWLTATMSLGFLFSMVRSLLANTRFVSIVFKIFSLMLVFFAIKMVYQSIVFFLK